MSISLKNLFRRSITAQSCSTCSKKIAKHKPSLFCDIRNTVSHYQCNYLTRSEALYIIENNQQWTCHKCVTYLFPIKLLDDNSKPHKLENQKNRDVDISVTHKCSSCSKRIMKPNTLDICDWCESPCHIKCKAGQLGCKKCASDIFPGFFCSNVELMGYRSRNYKI